MPDPVQLDLSIIIVNWNVRELLRGCLSSLMSCVDLELVGGGPKSGGASQPASPDVLLAEIIVVDNGSTDGSAAMVEADFPQVRLVRNCENQGFTRGNNQGLAISRGGKLLLLNPDTVTPPETLAALVRAMELAPGLGAMGPELRFPDGRLQPSRRRFPTFATALLESTPLAWHLPARLNRWSVRYQMSEEPLPVAGSVQPVDWLVGAALLLRREALAEIGGLDEGYFMYSEELDWCRRAADSGWGTGFLAGVSIIHYEGRSSEQVVAARHIRFQSSKVRYFRKFHGRLAAETLRLFLLVSFALEWCLEATKWLMGRRRPLRTARLSAYGQLLRSRLCAVRETYVPVLWTD